MPPRKAKNEKKTETCDSARFPQNSSTTESKSTHNDHWTEINKSQIHVDLEEKLNESALENNDISMLSSSSTFASDLIDACANASAEMLDLHLTPYDLKSVHEYQISNHKKLTEVIQLLKCFLEEQLVKFEMKFPVVTQKSKVSNKQAKAFLNNLQCQACYKKLLNL